MSISLKEFANIMGDAAEAVGHEWEDEAVMKACRLVQRRAKRFIGKDDNPYWPALAETTIEDKARHHFPTPKALLRTGSLRDSIEIDGPFEEGPETTGYVYSNHPVAAFQELGTSRIPPRPFIGLAAMASEADIHRMFAAAALDHQFRQWKLAKKLLGIAWDEIKEMVEEDKEANDER